MKFCLCWCILLIFEDFLQLQLLTQRISKKLAEGQNNISENVRQLLRGENSEVVNRALIDYISSLDSNIELESREEDCSWFEGLHDKYQTKEEVMKDGAKTRIKNYYQKTREYMLEQVFNMKYDAILHFLLFKLFHILSYSLYSFQSSGEDAFQLLDMLRHELRLNDYNGEYFVRSAEKNRICDKLGWFKCEGKFDKKVCAESHSINPYGLKEARIVFSTWNLDHV